MESESVRGHVGDVHPHPVLVVGAHCSRTGLAASRSGCKEPAFQLSLIHLQYDVHGCTEEYWNRGGTGVHECFFFHPREKEGTRMLLLIPIEC